MSCGGVEADERNIFFPITVRKPANNTPIFFTANCGVKVAEAVACGYRYCIVKNCPESAGSAPNCDGGASMNRGGCSIGYCG